jgi:hypothetical protein
LRSRSLVILEIGCGLNVPAVREEGLEVLRDVHAKGAGDRAHLIRVNLKSRDAGYVEGVDLDLPEEVKQAVLGLQGTAEGVLRMLDEEIENIAREETCVKEEEQDSRTLVFDDDWMDEFDGGGGAQLVSQFGEYGDDQDVQEKLALEEEEREAIERIEVERKLQEEKDRVAEVKFGGREMVFEDF